MSLAADGVGAPAAALRSWVLLDDAPVALATISREGLLTRANARFCALVGRAEPQLVSEPLRRLLHEEDRPGHDRELQILLAGGTSYRRDERYVQPDGTEVWATNEIACEPFDCGAPALLLVAHASSALRARAELARERAESEVRRRDEFLSLLSHELRSPLAAIMVWARLLRDGGFEPAEAQRGLEVIERSGGALERMLDDLSCVSHIASGRLRLGTRTAVDLRSLANGASDSLRAEAEAKGVSLSSRLPSEAVVVNGDPARLQQAIASVLGNAVKFTPRGGGVELAVEVSADEVALRTTDSGEGMSPSFLPLVFERFRHSESSTARHRGLGLGLYIVRHLVALHDGRVEATSPGLGKGSIVTIRLPLESSAKRGSPGGLGRTPLPAGLKVLVVDDDDDTREALRLILKQNGVVVETASAASEAVERLQTTLPDVLLSDIAMPGEDGFAFIRRVRTLPPERGGRVPAAALTAYASPHERTAALQAGFDRHVPKPVDPPELLSVIAELAALRR